MFLLKNRSDPKLSEANFHVRFCHLKQLLKNIHPMILASFLFSGEQIFTVITLKNPQNDRPYAHPSIKKKDVVTKRLPIQLAFSKWQPRLASNKWLTVHQFDTCRSWRQGYWGVLIAIWCCYNSFCLPHVESQASSSFFSRTVPWVFLLILAHPGSPIQRRL